jgi:hydroxypyruvate reductase/glycerate 2-kinase
MESISDKHSRILRHHKATLDQVVTSMKTFSLKLDTTQLPNEIYLLAIGKASEQMLDAFSKSYSGSIIDGVVLSPDPIPTAKIDKNIHKLSFFTGTHPLPSEENEASTLEILSFIKNLPAGATLVCLISGGTSSLLCLPPDSISIADLQQTYDVLLRSGASIHEMNTVRKHISLVKGGQLAQFAHHLRLRSYLLSDVPIDTAHVIGSGPTLNDPSTYKEALDILYTHKLKELIPKSVREYLEQGALGRYPETPKPGLNDHPDQEVHLITGSKTLQPFLQSLFEQQGFAVHWSERPIHGSQKTVVREVAGQVISVLNGQSEISQKSPQALVFQGESYLEVKGEGAGGRNQHLALLLALSLEGQHPVSVLSLATDGVDGPTDAAGALVSSYTTLHARKQGHLPEPYIQHYNSYAFHEAMNTLIKIGPSGTNLMDLCVVLIR